MYEKNINVGAGDGNEPNWSGALVCHRLIQHEDGTLSCGEVPGIRDKYAQPQEVKVMEELESVMDKELNEKGEND